MPTDTEKGPHSGTQNMGSTGWIGGQTDQKKTNENQPDTAQGLDPTKPGQNKPTAHELEPLTPESGGGPRLRRTCEVAVPAHCSQRSRRLVFCLSCALAPDHKAL